MSYLHLTRERTRERSPVYDTRYRPLVRRDSKRYHSITLSDDEDDYPYSCKQKPVRSSRTLTICDQPSQLERYNIWYDSRNNSYDDDKEKEKIRYERRKTTKYTPYRPRYSDLDDDIECDVEGDDYKLRVRTTFSKPDYSSFSYDWPRSSPCITRETWTDEDWETRRRSRATGYIRRASLRDCREETDEENESWSRYRRIKRSKTGDSRPLSGWRRERLFYDAE